MQPTYHHSEATISLAAVRENVFILETQLGGEVSGGGKRILVTESKTNHQVMSNAESKATYKQIHLYEYSKRDRDEKTRNGIE